MSSNHIVVPRIHHRSPSPTDLRKSEESRETNEPRRTFSFSSGLSATDDSQGLLSAIYSVAHNAANIIGAKHGRSQENVADKSGDDFSRLKNSLNISTESSTASENMPHEAQASIVSGSDRGTSLTPANVNFEPVHESPINTLGNGDLSLDHFERKESRATVNKSTQVPVKGNPFNSETHANKLVMSGQEDSKVVRKKSISGASFASGSSEHSLPTVSSDNQSINSGDLSNFDLDQAVERKSSHQTKKDKEFHSTFKKIPTSEPLLADYSCALSKDILVQGKMYVSPHFICFNSNILGWVTHLVIPFQEIVQIEKKSTAVLFPNGMVIRTLHQKFVFATFLSRDATFKTITSVWDKALQENVGGDTRTRRNTRRSSTIAPSADAAFSGYSSSDEDGGDASNDEDLVDVSDVDNEADENEGQKQRKGSDTSEEADNSGKEAQSPDGKKAKKSGSVSGPGPTSHEPTNFEHEKDSNETHLMDHTFKAPMGTVLNILYGADSSHFVGMLEKQKNTDVTKDKITELMAEGKEREYSYIKPLSGPIGPKQTKCIISEKVLHFDLENYCEIEQVTQSPDVPSGNSFKVKTRQFFSWDANNATKVAIFTSVEWSAKSWIKSAVEKGSLEGQKSTWKIIVDSVEEILSSGGGASPKKRRRKTQSSINAPRPAAPAAPAEPESFGSKIVSLCESCGQMIPVQIPYMNDAMKGGVAFFFVSLLYSLFISRLLGGPSGGQRLTFGDKSSKMVSIDNDRYFLFPTSNTFLQDEIGRKKNEEKLWQWLLERTEGKHVHASSSSAEKSNSKLYSDAELHEMLKITKSRIDEIYEHIA